MLDTIRMDEIGLLLLIHRLQLRGRMFGSETLVPAAEVKLPRIARAYNDLVGSLLHKGLIEGDADYFELTPNGQGLLDNLSRVHSLHAWFYNEYYQTVQKSKAHSLFCERAYGKDLAQHGMANMQQLDRMLAELEIEPSMSVLDFGCGDGRISEHIADVTQARVVGTDIAKRAIEIAQQRTAHKADRVGFCWADIEHGQGDIPQGPFDRVIAIDSFFFVNDQRRMFDLLYNYLGPDGRLAIFDICPPDTYADETELGCLLEELKLSYCVLDLSAENTRHWQLKKQVLLDLESRFYAEGNDFLYKNRITECYGMEAYHRYLYIVYAPL